MVVCSLAKTILAGSLVLVTGATGFTGQHLVSQLLSQNARVRALIRPDGDRRSLADAPVEWVEGRIWDERLVGDAMKGVDYVFHLASVYRRPAESDRAFHDVHVASTRALARAAQKEPEFKRFVHVSTIGVHGHIQDPPADEASPFAPDDVYQSTKLEAEQWIRSFGHETKLPVSVVRPAGIYGPGDERLFKVFKMATYRLVPIVGFGRCLYHLVHVNDLVKFLFSAATHPRATGETFICASKEPIALADFIRTAGSVYGIQNAIVRVPASPVMAAAHLCEQICKPLGIKPPIYPRRIAFYTKDRAFDASKMTRELGFVTSIENDRGIREVARWYVDNGWIERPPGMKT